MKKGIAALCLLLIIISVAGCKKGEEQDLPLDNEDSLSSEVTDSTNPIESEEENNSQSLDNNADTGEKDSEVEDNGDIDGDTSDESNKDAEDIVTPVDDVYTLASEPIDFDYSQFDEIVPQEVTDESVLSEIEEYLSDFYFNYYFLDGVSEETGEVGIDAMTLFSLSYIMQHEYDELRFDYDTYQLFIPKQHVIDIVEKYFYRRLDVFNSYEDLDIFYSNDTFIVKVEASEWDVDFHLSKVEKLGDFTYRVSCKTTNKTTGLDEQQIVAIVDESHDGYVLINYSVADIEE